MNIQDKLKKKRRKLEEIKDILKEEIYSQLKYLEYNEKKEKLENDIKRIEEIVEKHENKNEKIWIDMGNGWKRRINITKR